MSGLRMLRADITAAEHAELRAIAARKSMPAAVLVAQALRTSPATRAAFRQTKETRDK